MSTSETTDTPLRAVALICSLKPSPAPSSSALIAEHLFVHLREVGVECDAVRCVDYNIAPGVEADMGDSDQWPQIRRKVVDADILVIATPTWMGHMSSVAQRALERLDAELSNTDDSGKPAIAGKVAIAAVVGNEDGAHKIVADKVSFRLREWRIRHSSIALRRCRSRRPAGDGPKSSSAGSRSRDPAWWLRR
jgi:multimeric flavodoxin WrbA